MGALSAGRVWSLLAGVDLVVWLLGLGMAAFTIALVVLIWTRWGQYRPVQKCLVLSLAAHLLLAGYATTVKIVGMNPSRQDGTVQISLIDGPGGSGGDGDQSPRGGEDAVAAVGDFRPGQPAAANGQGGSRQADSCRPVEGAGRKSIEPPKPVGLTEDALATAVGAADRVPAASMQPQSEATSKSDMPAAALPAVYRLRLAPNCAALAQGRGGSPECESAVQAALDWLARNESPDGHWSVRQHEGGRAASADGRDRRHAGVEADTAVTGLALLAFLASGQTHRDGLHKDEVRRGLEYLVSVQADDGNLAGRADVFARMYSHAMAAFALSEAYGMTGDVRLREAVQRAVAYTVAAQDPYGGGWRYRPGDPGDTSQLGWQLMALKSAELAGVPIPDATREGMVHFLRSVGSGSHGGLASYRPGEQTTRSMTAEALFCWQILGMARDDPAGNEAGDLLLGATAGTRPGQPLLLVLRHAGHVPVAGRLLAAVERGPADAIAGQSADRGAVGRQLGPGRRLGRLRRTDLQHFALRPSVWRFTTATSPSIRNRERGKEILRLLQII